MHLAKVVKPLPRILMEEHLGRELTYDEVVHHINEDPKDNSIENLQVMSRGEHTILHHEGIEHGRNCRCNSRNY